MRNILKMKSSTPLFMVYGEFGRYPLEIQVKVRMIKFWSKLARTAKYHLKCIDFYCICMETIFAPRHDKTNKVSVRPAKTQISLCAQWVAMGPGFLHADSEDSDQTGRMPRLI